MISTESALTVLALRALLAACAFGACWLASHAALAWFGAIGAELVRRTGCCR
jgi:hypothetical protein